MSQDKLKEIASDSRSKLLCLEVNPPRGVDVGEVFARLDGQLKGIDFFNVTDSALARMRLAAFPFAAMLKQRFNVEPLVNISCRDRNLIAIQGDLLGAWASGVRSVVALTGDAVTIGDDPERKGVFEVNSIGLLNVISTMNSGRDLVGNQLKGAPAFVSGVVVNPNARNPGAELRRLQRKREAGATYALSQPVFDEEVSRSFFSEASKVGVPIFMGLMPIKSAKALKAIDSIPGIKLSSSVVSLIESAPEESVPGLSIEHCLKLAELNRDFVRGFHVVCGASAKLGLQLARELAKLIAASPD